MVGVMGSITMVVGRLLLILLHRHREDTLRIPHRLLLFLRSNHRQRPWLRLGAVGMLLLLLLIIISNNSNNNNREDILLPRGHTRMEGTLLLHTLILGGTLERRSRILRRDSMVEVAVLAGHLRAGGCQDTGVVGTEEARVLGMGVRVRTR